MSGRSKYQQKINFFYTQGENKDIKSLSKLDEIYFSIGPEGGFSPKEIDKMKSNGLEGITLGQLVIKTETVPTVLLSMLKTLNK
jgi:RsmE family RNA methyltransferase